MKDLYNLLIIVLAPTAGPINVQVSNTSSTSLLATWNAPPLNETHGIIREHSIRYQDIACGVGNVSSITWVERTVNGSTTSLDITGLMKWTCYEVQVRAVTIKNGIYSRSVKQRTSEDGKMINQPTSYSEQTFEPLFQSLSQKSVAQSDWSILDDEKFQRSC